MAAPVIGRLTRRPDFLAAASGRRVHSRLLTLQARRREASADEARLGMTITRKTGGAVERNRIRRRLRAALAEVAPLAARAGYDYVIVARRPALGADYRQLTADLVSAFRRVHAANTSRPAPDPSGAATRPRD